MITIRKATIKDLKAIQDLSYKLFIHDEAWIPHLIMDWSFEKEGAEYFTSHISEKDGVAYVAEDEGTIVGYVTAAIKKDVSWRSVKIAELGNIFVEEEYRHNNVGKRLFAEFKKWAKNQDARILTVSASFPNSSAIEFYKTVGFEPYSLELEIEI